MANLQKGIKNKEKEIPIYRQKFNDFIAPLQKDKVLFQNSLDSFLINVNQMRNLPKKLFKLLEIEKLYQNFCSSFQRKSWPKESQLFFIWLISYYCLTKQKEFGDLNKNDWDFISKMLPKVSLNKIQLKFLSMKKCKAQTNLWLIEEEELLSTLVIASKKPYKWSKLAEEFNEKSPRNVIRLPKHCREKWNNHLDPDLKKSEWNFEEDFKILQKVHASGYKWAEISKILKGRNENSIKNRYFTLMHLHSELRKKNKMAWNEEKKLIEALIKKMQLSLALNMVEAQNQINFLAGLCIVGQYLTNN